MLGQASPMRLGPQHGDIKVVFGWEMGEEKGEVSGAQGPGLQLITTPASEKAQRKQKPSGQLHGLSGQNTLLSATRRHIDSGKEHREKRTRITHIKQRG